MMLRNHVEYVRTCQLVIVYANIVTHNYKPSYCKKNAKRVFELNFCLLKIHYGLII